MRVRSVEANEPPAAIAATASTSTVATQASPQHESEQLSTIMEIEGSTTSATMPPSQTSASAREKRYRELLGTPPPGTTGTPPPVAAAPASEPSLLEKVVRPIADALGVRRPPPAAADATRRPQPSQQQPPAQEPAREDPKKSEPKRNEERADADADILAPRLLSAEFVPPQVQDGEQTMLIVNATDDLSGLRNVSGVIVSPSGGQQGFACQREGDTGRFTARITVPREAAEGDWTIRYLTITDNASNAAQLTAAQGALPPTARFRVISAASDSKGPVLRAVWLQDPTMSAGQKNVVNIRADDDGSGMNLVSGVFVSPKKQARMGFGCRALPSGNLFQCAITPASCADCGGWQLEQIQLQDNANNVTTLRADNELLAPVRLELIGDACDSTPPVLQSLVLDPVVVSNAAPSVVKVTAFATDDQCGVASLSGRAEPPPGTASSGLTFPMRQTGDGQTFVGEIQVPQHAANGLWTIIWINALDKGHNQKPYTTADPVVARATFRVE